MRSPCCLLSVSPPPNLFACVFVTAGMSLPSRYLATVVSSSYTIPASRHHITLYSKVVERGVFYAVSVI
jgi:hypothetical protein